MTWFVLSLVSALGLATADALTKRFFSDLSPYRMAVVRSLAVAPWMILALLFLPSAVPDRTFWLAIAAALPLELSAYFLYMRALKLSPLSLSLPFLAFTPVFMILTGRFILDESITPGGSLGIGFIAGKARLFGPAEETVAEDTWIASDDPQVTVRHLNAEVGSRPRTAWAIARASWMVSESGFSQKMSFFARAAAATG